MVTEHDVLTRIEDKIRMLELERRGIVSGARLKEINDALAQLALSRLRLTRDMAPARGGLGYLTRSTGGRRR